jgi:hypothetical protein
MLDLTETANRLSVLWRSGRNQFASFFTILNDVQLQVGPEQLEQWCVDNLKLHISVIAKVTAILREVDAERERRALAPARQAQRLAEVERRQRDLERRRDALAERQRTLAEIEQLRQTKPLKQKRKARGRDSTERTLRAIAAVIAPHPDLAALLAEAQRIERTSRIELGRIYVQIKELVQSGRAGKDELGRSWTWGHWCEVYIPKSRQDIHKCIQEFVASCDNSQENNVTPFPKIA